LGKILYAQYEVEVLLITFKFLQHLGKFIVYLDKFNVYQIFQSNAYERYFFGMVVICIFYELNSNIYNM